MEYAKVTVQIPLADMDTALRARGYKEEVDGSEIQQKISFLQRKIVEQEVALHIEFKKMEQARIAQENAPIPPEIVVNIELE